MPAFSLPHIQAKLPEDLEIWTLPTGRQECGRKWVYILPRDIAYEILVFNWKYRFTRELLLPIIDEVFGANAPRYSVIVRWDRKIREFPIPTHLIYPLKDGGHDILPTDTVSSRLWLQRAYLVFLRESSKSTWLLTFHCTDLVLFQHYWPSIDRMSRMIVALQTSLMYSRRYFGQNLQDCSENPFEGKFGDSVSAAYRCCSRIVEVMTDITQKQLGVVSRTWWFWHNLFDVAVSPFYFIYWVPLVFINNHRFPWVFLFQKLQLVMLRKKPSVT